MSLFEQAGQLRGLLEGKLSVLAQEAGYVLDSSPKAMESLADGLAAQHVWFLDQIAKNNEWTKQPPALTLEQQADGLARSYIEHIKQLINMPKTGFERVHLSETGNNLIRNAASSNITATYGEHLKADGLAMQGKLADLPKIASSEGRGFLQKLLYQREAPQKLSFGKVTAVGVGALVTAAALYRIFGNKSEGTQASIS